MIELLRPRNDDKLDDMRKRQKSDSVLWQKPWHQQKTPKSKVTTQKATKNCDDTTIAPDLWRSVEVTTATELVCYNW